MKVPIEIRQAIIRIMIKQMNADDSDMNRHYYGVCVDDVAKNGAKSLHFDAVAPAAQELFQPILDALRARVAEVNASGAFAYDTDAEPHMPNMDKEPEDED